MKPGHDKLRNFLLGLAVFAIGAVITVAPFFIRAHFIHADETARREQTMAPGITMFMGMLASPFGGAVAVLLWRWLRRRAESDDYTDDPTPRTQRSAEHDASTADQNPYAATAYTRSVANPANKRSSLPITGGVACAVALTYGVTLAAAVTLGLCFVVLMPPMCHWCDLDGEFDGLIIIGIPPLAAGFAVAPSLLMAAARRHRWRVPAAAGVSAVSAAGFVAINLVGNGHVRSIVTLGGVLLLGLNATVFLLSIIFNHIERRRTHAAEKKARGITTRCSVLLSGVLWMTSGLAAVSLLLSLLHQVETDPEFLRWAPIVAVPMSMLMSSYLTAVYPFQSSFRNGLWLSLAMIALLVIRIGLDIL